MPGRFFHPAGLPGRQRTADPIRGLKYKNSVRPNVAVRHHLACAATQKEVFIYDAINMGSLDLLEKFVDDGGARYMEVHQDIGPSDGKGAWSGQYPRISM